MCLATAGSCARGQVRPARWLLLALAAVLSWGSGAARAEGRGADADLLGCRRSLGWARRGGVGLFDMPLPDPGCAWQLRATLWADGFVQSGYLLSDDRNQQLGGAVLLDATLGPYVELWTQIGTRANRNQRPSTAEASNTRPTLALGRTALGLKLHGPLGRLLHVGLQSQLRVHSGPDDFGPNLSSVDGGIDALVSVDLGRLPRLRSVPLRFAARLGYLHDRSGQVVGALDCMAQGATECLATRLIYTAAYAIGQPRVELGVSTDVAFALGGDVWMMALASYSLGVVTGPGDAVLRAQLSSQVPTQLAALAEDRVGQLLSLGARLILPWPVALDVGLQVALSSWGYVMGAKLPQVAGYGGISFAFDLSPVRRAGGGDPDPLLPETTPRRTDAALRDTGSVRGLVRDRSSRAPLPGAIVRFVGLAQNALLTDARGVFESGPLPPGSLDVEVSRSDHQTTRTTVLVRGGEVTVAEIAVDATPRAVPARLLLTLSDEHGTPIGSALSSLSRAGQVQPLEVLPQTTPGQTTFAAKVIAGAWRLRVDTVGFLSREILLVLSPGEERPLHVRLTARGHSPKVALATDEILLSEPLQFAGDPARPLLTPGSMRLLDEVIDLLVHHPEIAQLRIEAAAGDRVDTRLITVREYLVQNGVAPERVRAVELSAEDVTKLRSGRIGLRIAR